MKYEALPMKPIKLGGIKWALRTFKGAGDHGSAIMVFTRSSKWTWGSEGARAPPKCQGPQGATVEQGEMPAEDSRPWEETPQRHAGPYGMQDRTQRHAGPYGMQDRTPPHAGPYTAARGTAHRRTRDRTPPHAGPASPGKLSARP